MLYVPGCTTRYLNKSRTLNVDSVILDLGDPILVEAKLESRRNVVESVLAGGFGRREVVVRVNDLDSPWGADDVKAVAGIGADAVCFPNVESPCRRRAGASPPSTLRGPVTCPSW